MNAFSTATHPLVGAVADKAEAFDRINDTELDALMDRIGDARVVLIGEASHGTSEFYRMRQRITAALVERKGFNLIGAEADWPDAEHVDDYVRLRDGKADRPREAFARFPSWMWRNAEVHAFVSWLRAHNEKRKPAERASFHGLDLYSMYASIHEVVEHLDREDAELAEVARHRYSGLLAYEPEPQNYGLAALRDRDAGCEEEVVAMLKDLLHRRLAAPGEDRERLFDPEQNARVVADGETYYRAMYRGGRVSWNLRDGHMFETLKRLMKVRRPDAKAVVWAHNSHVGNAGATEMSLRGETNIGKLCREHFGEAAYLIGFGTHTGTVAAAHNWDEPVRIMDVRPSMKGSCERVCHEHGPKRFFLPLRAERRGRERQEALLQRAIGVIYRPETELQSHYFDTRLPEQFDEYIWFDRSEAVTPLTRENPPDLPDRHPFRFVD